MASGMRVTSLRVLLAGCACREWFLGERVYHWTQGLQRRWVPHPPPADMFWGTRVADLASCLAGTDARSHIFEGNYLDFFPQLLGLDHQAPPPSAVPPVSPPAYQVCGYLLPILSSCDLLILTN